jgi:hypothetical protein
VKAVFPLVATSVLILVGCGGASPMHSPMPVTSAPMFKPQAKQEPPAQDQAAPHTGGMMVMLDDAKKEAAKPALKRRFRARSFIPPICSSLSGTSPQRKSN